MPQSLTIKARGLYTFQNSISEIPDGALTDANNIVIDKEGTITSRRGFDLYGNSFGGSSTTAKQLITYKNRILRHWSTNLDADINGLGNFSTIDNATTEPVSGQRIKFQESNGNLYYTSNAGIRKLSLTDPSQFSGSQVTFAGGVAALDGVATLDPQEGWFIQDSTVAYRIVWGIKDNNTNVILGSPSERIIISNPMSVLLVTSLNTLLNDLTTAAAVTSPAQVLFDPGFNVFRQSPNASPSQIYYTLLTLANGPTNVLDNVFTQTLNSNTHSNMLVDGISSTANLIPGMIVTGSGIPNGVGSPTVQASMQMTLIQQPTDGDTLTLTLPSLSTITTTFVTASPSGNQVQIGATIQATAANLNTALNTTSYYTGDITSALSSGTTITATAGANYIGFAGNGLSFSSSNTANFAFIPSNGVFTGGVTNGTQTVITDIIDANSLHISENASTSLTATPLTYASVTFQNIPAPSDPVDGTTQELIAVQNYLNAVVTALNTSPGISGAAKSSIGGFFPFAVTSSTVDLIFTIPQEITLNHFYQIYRSDLATSTGVTTLQSLTPDDELRLIFESNPTSGDLSNGYIFYLDIVPESFRIGGAFLYTNANSGEGILQSNAVPPLARDLALFQGTMFYANTQTEQSVNLSLLTAIGLNSGTFTITQGLTVNTYTFVTNAAQVTNITTPAGSTFNASGTANYFNLFNANNVTEYRVWFSVGTSTAPSGVGVTLVPVIILSGDTNSQVATKLAATLNGLNQDFTTTVSTNVVTITNQNTGYTNSTILTSVPAGFTDSIIISGAGERASTLTVGVSTAPTPAQEVDATARSLVRIINKNAAEVINAAYLSGPSDVPGLMSFSTRSLGSPVFTITSSAGIAADFSPTLGTTGTTSTNEVNPNRVFYSKLQQPEAVPLVNYFDVGPKDKNITRILALRYSLFVLTEAGVYFVSGTDGNFQVTLFDGSVNIKAPDTAVILNNQIYAFSDQGVVTISDTGVSVISRPIENLVVPIITFPNYITAAFGVAYEADRAYLLWIPSSSTDTIGTECLRYNTFTNTWVKWNIEKTCGIVLPQTTVLYLGAGDTNFVEQERKSFTRLDYADRSSTLTINSNQYNNLTGVFSLGSLFNSATGDSLVQTQYLTLFQYNTLLHQLDSDRNLLAKPYFIPNQSNPGDNLRNKLTTLATQLDTDGALSGGYSAAISGYSSSFIDTQSAFNTIVSRLIADPGTAFKGYLSSTGTTGYEVSITATDSIKHLITVAYPLPFIQGPIVLYKGIDSYAQWAPHTFGDVSSLKHIREFTFVFQNMAFTSATASFSSDLEPGFAPVPFPGEGNGVWGNNVFGSTIWGGEGTNRPLRTYMPLDKQRCRYVSAEFEHIWAFEQYAVWGLSYTYEILSSRAYG